ncbi:P-loop containing nucleoside triphosphate hydrolase protein [Linderina pennispora]|uniref:p-loop containing nucleoside triphosphate hydrolase protein n=1 Tax=Linderina pennispora TaxID=61395 RepID=A0A1Y1W3X8_9FUNG|nr:P-loop containing nucleoside triphosphate hydrolase protein [Linderina pennispora]ORX68025.1 P-loop containing nucleoside triphosphate hydrolase protein [Linderina pennispora]
MALARTFAPELLSQLALSIVFTTLSFSGPFFMQRILWSIQEHQKNPARRAGGPDHVSAEGKLASILTSDFHGESPAPRRSMSDLYSIPLQFAIGAWYLYSLLGDPGTSGPGSDCALLSGVWDDVLSMITEMLKGMRAVKLFGWEAGPSNCVEVWLLYLVTLPINLVVWTTPNIIFIVVFGINIGILGQKLTADISSLLSALVGEMKLTSGRIVLPVADAFLADARHGSHYRDIIALTRQQHIEAWLRNATIRDNILFGSGYDQMRYEEVLRVCALKPDLRIFPAGDLTEVGERGIALSGGQRQRVALARAVYSSKQILLIDDCLSASPLMHGRTRILVTHHVLACLKHCDYVLVLRGGQVALRGSPQEILGELDKYDAEGSSDTTMIGKSTSGISDFTSEDTYNAERHTRTSAVTPVVNDVLDTSEEFWIKIWINSLNDPLVRYLSSSAAEPGPEHSTAFWLSWFVAIGFFVSAMRLLLHRVIHANGRFFDTTPIGHIISRFAQDIRTVDELPIETISSALSQLTYSLIVLAIITYVTPPFAIVAVAVTAGYGLIARYYLGAQRELKRMELVTMEPLLSLFSEVIGGAEAMGRMDFHNRPFYLMWAANRWLSTSIECLSLIISFATAVGLFLRLDSIDSGIAGFVLVFATGFTDALMMSIRSYSNCEQQLGSVERIDGYLNIEQEHHEDKDGLVVEYTPGVPVLQSLTFHVNAGERIGVVGRTGAGKSTLSLAFLRFVEAAQGRIVVDGIDISQIGLERLRNAITIIPQDPVLFHGTIRFNLDPFDECPDEILLDALRRTCLLRDESRTDNGGIVMDIRMPGVIGSLEDKVEENGQNLSLGQRQLVALARALVRRSKIIIMDEATASVDFDTDSRFQRSVCTSEFAGSTLFCIAHRLRTIINYDRVLVLDKGKIAEFDTPAVLLGKRDSMFRTLCQQSGEFDQLIKCVC